MDHHLYADDTQIYISLTTPDACRSLNQLRDWLIKIQYSVAMLTPKWVFIRWHGHGYKTPQGSDDWLSKFIVLFLQVY